MNNILLSAGLVLLLSAGCTPSLPFQFHQGSRADGIVSFQQPLTLLDYPKPNYQDLQSQAKRLCKNWGYEDASLLTSDPTATEDEITAMAMLGAECIERDLLGVCETQAFRLTYQCTDPK